jgi:membrane protein YqaA with SNARE-associated domain
MIEIFTDLSDWVVGFADSDWSVLVLAVLSFSEAIFFPVPPDLLLIGIAVRQPEAALWLAAVATVSSVAGALVGHWLGQRFGRRLLFRFVSARRVEMAERMFMKHGAWAVAVAAFTPIPYKVFAISAGALNLDRRSFVLASLIGRGGRFFLLGGLMFAYGDSIEQFVSDHFQMLTIVVGAGLVAGIVAALIFARWRGARKAVG